MNSHFIDYVQDLFHNICWSHVFVNLNVERVWFVFSGWLIGFVHLVQAVTDALHFFPGLPSLDSLNLAFVGQVENDEHQIRTYNVGAIYIDIWCPAMWP